MNKFYLILALALLGGQGSAYAETYKLTAYCPCTKCCGDFPGKIRGQTSSGAMATAGRTLAAAKGVKFGTVVVAVVDGRREVVGVVEDRGGAITERRLDLYFDSHAEALRFGVQQVDITFLTEGAE